ncbi:hypothetical protein [Klebsiella pneumoniae]|uniref:hypothetical protein n=1 Tax=Klebsiella pneumoniae TaxID=573 RepID=UPI0038909CFB
MLFNTTPHLSTIFGLRLPWKKRTSVTPNLMRVDKRLNQPMAAGGHRRLHILGIIKVIAAGMVSIRQQGSLLGPILALLVYNLPHLCAAGMA